MDLDQTQAISDYEEEEEEEKVEKDKASNKKKEVSLKKKATECRVKEYRGTFSTILVMFQRHGHSVQATCFKY